MKLIIPRRIWLRGLGADGQEGPSKLYRSKDGKMCCVGIYLEALGCSRDTLRDVSSAHFLILDDLPEEARWLVEEDPEIGITGSKIAFELYRTNDLAIVPEGREKKIKKLFAQQGIEVEYHGFSNDT